MSDPRLVTVSIAQIRTLTILEIARAAAIAHVNRADTENLLRSLMRADSPPEDLERAATLVYAWAWQLAKRDDPTITWDEAQTWRVEFDVTSDDEADIETDLTVRAAVVSGLPPNEAAQLTLAELDVYAEIAASRGA